MKYKYGNGFTIVELLIVIVVIGILAAVTILGFSGIRSRAETASTQLAAKQAFTKVAAYAAENNDMYPADLAAMGLANSGGTTYQYTVNNSATPRTFCLTATTNSNSYYVSNEKTAPTSGVCSGHNDPSIVGINMQLITSSNCSTTRTRAIDARDNKTYWVQKLADGKCWMLTNLAYAGGGTNTYSDVKTIADGTGGSPIYTAARYYIPSSGVNSTTEPTNPSTSTTGAGQYGYAYNWCAALGVQTSTSACSNSTTPLPDAAISICPAGWRLPTGTVTTGELPLLNNAINSGSLVSDAGLRTTWLVQRTGEWYSGFLAQGDYGYYWSSTQNSGTTGRYMYAGAGYVDPAVSEAKSAGLSVRCVAV